MKKDRDMYFENQNQGYFTNPGMMNPMMPNGSIYSNGMMQMGPNAGYGNMNYPQTFPNYPNNQMYNPNGSFGSIEQRINRMERQIKRLDSRVARLESKCNINTSNYQSTNDGYNINENDMYML